MILSAAAQKHSIKRRARISKRRSESGKSIKLTKPIQTNFARGHITPVSECAREQAHEIYYLADYESLWNSAADHPN